MKLLLAVIFVILSVTTSIQYEQGLKIQPSSCTTPNGDVGVCVVVQTCSIFMDAIRSRKADSYDFMRVSQCGPSNQDPTNPKVCCGLHNTYVSEITTAKAVERFIIPNEDLFPKTCGKYTPGELTDDRIYNGHEARLGEFPWMARLRHRRSDGLLSYGCAGFLISERFVLTAAHCIYSKTLQALGPIYQVQLGEHNTDIDLDCTGYPRTCADPPQWLRTAKPIVHPDYSNDNQYHNDIAVIPLKEPAKMTDYVNSICLSKTPSQETQLWLSGWGKTERKKSSSVKLKVSVPRADWTHCSDLYRTRAVRVLNTQVCAGGVGGRDSCTGDSGGPLMVLRNSTWHAEGIVSVGKGCGEEGWPAIYTNIPHYISWIELVINQYLEEHEDEEENDDDM